MERMRALINFIHRVSMRQHGEATNNISKDFRLSIVFIGRSEIIKRYRYGYEPYINYIKHAIEEGIEIFYVMARGRLHTFIANLVANELENQKKVIVTDRYIDKVNYNGSTIDVAYFRLEKK